MAVRCPTCDAVYPDEVFNCPRCEAILQHELPERRVEPANSKEPTVVRRMLSPPDATIEAPAAVHPADEPSLSAQKVQTSPTLRSPYPEQANGRPMLVPGVDLTEISLTVFEAFVVSRIDGSTSIDELRQALDLSNLEMHVVIATLKEKKIIEVINPEGSSARPSRGRGARSLRSFDPDPPSPKQDRKAPVAMATPPSPRTVEPPSAPRPPRTPSHRPATPGSPRVISPQPRRAEAPGPGPRGGPLRTGKSAAQEAQPPEKVGSRFEFLKKIGLPGNARRNPLQEAIKLEKGGDLAGAMDVLEEAILGASDPAPLYNRLAVVLVKERRDLERAEDLLEKAQELDPTNRTYQLNHQKILVMRTASSKKMK